MGYECPYPLPTTKGRKIHRFKADNPTWQKVHEWIPQEGESLQSVTENDTFGDWSDEEELVFDIQNPWSVGIFRILGAFLFLLVAPLGLQHCTCSLQSQTFIYDPYV